MDPEYGAHYRTLYEKHWWWRSREAFILERLDRRRPEGGYGRILDVGCGDGLFLPKLRAYGDGAPEGLEPDEGLLTDDGRARGTIYAQPFDEAFQPGKRYGLVVMLDVLEHLDDDRGALRKVHDLLEPGGLLVLTVPAFRALWTGHDDMNHHRTRYTRKTFRRAAEGSGLSIRELRYFFHWTVPLKLILRFKESLTRPNVDPPQVPSAPLNAFFENLSRVEQKTWGILPWPFGSSLLAICHRPAA